MACALAAPAAAQVQQKNNEPRADDVAVTVTGNPLGSSSLFDLAVPTSVLQGQSLVLRRASTLGETLSGEPGLSGSSFGPGASRPVIRGLDSDRVRILQNGVGMLDASSLSFDHAVAVDPLIADRIEVVRGPAALLYGGNAVGGVVNVIDNRVPQEPISGVSGAIEPRFGGADNEKSGAVKFEAGNGRFAVHVDAYGRKTDDLSIPGFARSSRQRAIDTVATVQPFNVIPNSKANSDGGALGGSLTWDKGYAGLAYSAFNSNYGSPIETGVRVDMKSARWDLAGEVRDVGGPIDDVKFKYGRTGYEHREIDTGVTGTVFKNRGYESRIEAKHVPVGAFRGMVGMQFNNSDFSALGNEAFVPATNTDSKGLFVYEELPLGDWKLNAGGRVDRNAIKSAGGGANVPLTSLSALAGTPRFGAAQARDFAPRALSFGAVYTLSKTLSIAANTAYTERAPTYAELFANGPHVATGRFEVGNSGFGAERSRAFDLALRLRSGPHSASVGVFYNRFSNFITLVNTGVTRDAAGHSSAVGDDMSDVGDGTSRVSNNAGAASQILPESVFRAVAAEFRGVETQGRFRLMDKGGELDLKLKADYVQATNQDSGQPLPRIAPLRLGAGLEYRFNAWSAALDVEHAARQGRVSANELPTDGYTLVNANLSYRFKSAGANWDAFARANNLLNAEARNHVSFVKDVAPMPGRGVLVGLRALF
jgi:iron complex outermembrane receptor protein